MIKLDESPLFISRSESFERSLARKIMLICKDMRSQNIIIGAVNNAAKEDVLSNYSDGAALLVISYEDMAHVDWIVTAAQRLLQIEPSVFAYFIGSSPPPIVGYRDDGPIGTFVAPLRLVADLVHQFRGSTAEFCFQASKVLICGRQTVARVFAREIEKPCPLNQMVPVDETTSITMIIAHRGPPSWLRTCLHYALRQEQVPDVFSIGLDGGTELADLDSFAREHEDLKVSIAEPDGVGPYVIRQRLALEARTPLLMFQDSDDLSCFDRAKRLKSEMWRLRSPFLGSHEVRVDDYSRTVRAVRYALDVRRSLETRVTHALLHPTAMIAREAFNRIGGFSTRRTFGSDTQFLFRSYFFLERIGNIDEFLYVRWNREGSLTNDATVGRGSAQRKELYERWKRDFEKIRADEILLENSSLAIEQAGPMPGVRRIR